MSRAASGIRARVEAVLEELRPFLQDDGGDVEIVDIDEAKGIVKLRMLGACHNCPSATVTLEHGIRIRLQEAVPEIRELIAV